MFLCCIMVFFFFKYIYFTIIMVVSLFDLFIMYCLEGYQFCQRLVLDYFVMS